MPILRFHGVQHEKIIALAPKLFDRLTKIYDIPDDYLNIEVDDSVWIDRNGIKEGFPIVEIMAFPRSAEVECEVATVLDELLKSAGYAESEQYFIHLKPENYYSNGKSFK